MTAFGTRSSSNTFLLAKSGDRKARNVFIADNELLVKKVIHHYSCTEDMYDDLYQEGCIGMLRALDKFDIQRGFKFSTYAVPWIRVMADRYLHANTFIVSMPMRTRELAFRVSAMCNKQSAKTVAEDLGLSLESVEALNSIRHGDLDFELISEQPGVDDLVQSQRSLDRLGHEFSKLSKDERNIALIALDLHPDYDSVAQYCKSCSLKRHDINQLSLHVMGQLQAACYLPAKELYP